MILGHVADDRTQRGMVKICAVVGAEATALPENMVLWIPLKPSPASESAKMYHLCTRREVGNWPKRMRDRAEGSSDRFAW